MGMLSHTAITSRWLRVLQTPLFSELQPLFREVAAGQPRTTTKVTWTAQGRHYLKCLLTVLPEWDQARPFSLAPWNLVAHYEYVTLHVEIETTLGITG